MLPTFVVVGAMKGGTRSLYEYLRAHPEVFMSRPKELDFFTDEWDRGVPWYAAHFDSEAAVSARARGEVSPSYTMGPNPPVAAQRMHQVMPDARVVYLVRHPVDRIESHYQHRLRKGVTLSPIDDEVRARPEYVATSSYAAQIAPFLDAFPADRVLVIASDRLRDRRAETMASVYRFLGVTPEVDPSVLEREYSRADDRRVPRPSIRQARRSQLVAPVVRRLPRSLRRRVGSVTSLASNAPDFRLSPAVRAELGERLADEVRRLKPLLPPDFDGWGLA